jgi:assimilatory nitrate reductase catalytic subunit
MMGSVHPVRTTCPYCGVGCGVLVDSGADGVVRVAGDPEHPANFGRLCSKGAALAETLGDEDRLLYPEIGGARVAWETALDAVAAAFTETIAAHGPEAVALYISGQLLTEDYYVANKLMKGFVGSGNIDSNSRLCMASSVAGYKRAFGSDTVPLSYADLEAADLVVLVGSNLAWCHPVLYQRLAAAKAARPAMRIVVVDPRRTATCDIADLHLPIALGSDVALFNGLLAHLAATDCLDHDYIERHCAGFAETLAAARVDAAGVAAICDVPTEQLAAFYALFATRRRTVTLWSQGVNQATSGTDKVNAIINCHLATGRIGRKGMGPFSITGQPNAMGGREVGGLATQLAAHMDFDEAARVRLARFWGTPGVVARRGHTASEMFRAVADGTVKTLWVIATNPAVSLPDGSRIREALATCPTVIVSDCVRSADTACFADILLPAAAWGEKDGTVTNSERRISRQRAFRAPPGEARPDWWMLAELARRLGFAAAFSYRGPADIFAEHARLTGFENDGSRDLDLSALAALDAAAYNALPPTQWGPPRLFAKGGFFTPNRRARLVPVRWRRPAHDADELYPLRLNTGRLRDQWHTMTRTGLVPRLVAHRPEPLLAIHPADAAAHGLAAGDFATLASPWGSVVLRVQPSDEQRRGELFAPMHWTAAFSAQGRVGTVINPDVDALSFQPELKHTKVRLAPWRPAWRGFALLRERPLALDAEYWVAAPGDGAWRVELAGTAHRDWPRWAAANLGAGEWLDLVDAAAGRFRAACIAGGRLAACLFVESGDSLPAGDWLLATFRQDAVAAAERFRLLAGRAADEIAAAGRTICACFGIGEAAIRAAADDDGATVTSIGAALKAGTNCGSCIPEIRALLAAARAAA